MDGSKIEVTNYILTSVAIFTTLFRIWDRVRNHRFGYDDVAAIICTAFQTLFLVDGNFYFHGPEGQSPAFRITVHILVLILIQAVAWTSKLILSLNLLRIVVLPGKLRTFLVIVSFVFAIIWPSIAALNVWFCMREPAWYDIPQPICSPGLASALIDIITNVIADLILIILPIWHVSRIRLSQADKIRASSVFLTSVIMTAVIIYHEYWVVKSDGVQEELSAVMHAGILLIVANLSVIIPFFFRIASQERARRALDRGPSNFGFLRPRTTISTFGPITTVNIRPDDVRPRDIDNASVEVVLGEMAPKSSSSPDLHLEVKRAEDMV